MKVLAIHGSPRRTGNTRAVLDIVLQAAQDAGAQTEVAQLSELKALSGCLECFACQQEASDPGCAVNDDLQDVLKKATQSDVVLWTTPVFCWSPSWLVKMAMDRFYCLFKFHEDGEHDSLLEGRRQAAIITAGGGEDDGADLVQESFRRLANFSKGEWLGALIAAHVENPDTIRADVTLLHRAREFGRKLANSS